MSSRWRSSDCKPPSNPVFALARRAGETRPALMLADWDGRGWREYEGTAPVYPIRWASLPSGWREIIAADVASDARPPRSPDAMIGR